MAYAINETGGWRTINSPDDVLSGETFSAEQPQVVELPSPRVLTYAEFEDRFTDEEADAIAALSLQNGAIHRVVTRAAASNAIDLDSERMALFMGALVQAGIITEGRAAEIVA